MGYTNVHLLSAVIGGGLSAGLAIESATGS
jgi:hypothetical protein